MYLCFNRSRLIGRQMVSTNIIIQHYNNSTIVQNEWINTSASYNSYASLSSDTRPSGETTKLHLQRGVSKRLQQIQTSKVSPALHRVQPARNATAPLQEPAHEDLHPLHLLLEGGLRVRYQQTQLTNLRRRSCRLPAPAA